MRYFSIILLLALAALGVSAKEKEPVKKKAEPEAAAEFFAPTALHSIHIRISYEQFNLMQPRRRARPATLDASSIPQPAAEVGPVAPAAPAAKSPAFEGDAPGPANYGYEYPYVKAHVELDDIPMADVGLRYKGNSSYEGTSRGLKRPMKIDFNRFVAGRKFLGQESLNLANNAFDPSFVRETLSYYVYRAAGVPAPRTSLAMVYLSVPGQCDREYIGCYTIVEEVDGDPFLKHHFGAAEIPVFKPESIRGLPYMGEDINNWSERYRPKTKPNPAAAKPLIEFVKLLNYADDATFIAKVDESFDVDLFLRYLACTALLGDLDSILANYHNFYLVVSPANVKTGQSGKVSFLPWDMNLSLASYGGGEQLVDLDIRHPWGGENKLISRFLTVDKYRDAYLAHVRKITAEVFNPAHLDPFLDRLDQVLEEPAEAAAASIPQTRMGPIGLSDERGRGWHGGGHFAPREYVAARWAAVVAQLDGKNDPSRLFVPRAWQPNVNRMGVRASPSMGNLSLMAQAIRRLADKNGDFAISPREARDAAAVLYYQVASEAHPESIDQAQLAVGLEQIVGAFGARGIEEAPRPPAGNPARGDPTRGWSRQRGRVTVSAGQSWSRAIFEFADSDGDGKLTLAELLAATDRLCCLTDPDHTDRLNERELTEGLDELVAPK